MRHRDVESRDEAEVDVQRDAHRGGLPQEEDREARDVHGAEHHAEGDVHRAGRDVVWARFTPEADLRQSLARLRASPFLPHRDAVRAFVYEVETGRLREVTTSA